MKTDEQYLEALSALFKEHFAWTDQQIIDVFSAEHGELKQDAIVRIYNLYVHKRNTPTT